MPEIFIGFFSTDSITPQVVNRNPDSGDVGVSVTTNIYLEIVEPGGAGVDTATVQIFVDGVLAFDGGAGGSQPGFSCTELPIVDGFSYTIDPASNLPGWTSIPIHVIASDLASNTVDTTYSFTTIDATNPVITPINPIDTQTAVSIDTNITINFTDEVGGSGIVLSTITIDIESNPAFNSGTFQAGWNGPGSQVLPIANGYQIIVDPVSDFLPFTTVNVSAGVEDVQGNTTGLAYSFETGSLTEITPPVVTFTSPGMNELGVATDTNIFFRITDTGSTVNLATLDVYVNGVPAILGGVFQAGFTGTALSNGFNGYDVLVTPGTEFSEKQIVTIRVEAADTALNVMPSFYSYFYTEGYATQLTPSGGSFNVPTSVTMSDNGVASSLYYTTDGSEPTPGDPGTTQVSSPFILPLPNDATTTIRLLGIETVQYTTTAAGHRYNNSVIRLWQMDEASGTTIGDESLFASNLVASNAAIVPGLIGNARQFTGDVLSRGHSPSDFTWLPVGTMEFWYKPDLAINPNTEHFYTVAGDVAETSDAYRFGRMLERLFMEDVGGTLLQSSVLTWNTSSQYHITFVWSGTGRAIYRNGVLVASDSSTMSTVSSARGELLGNSFTAINALLNEGTVGTLDSFRITNTQLSGTQILQDFQRGNVQIVILFYALPVISGIFTVDLILPVTTVAPNGGIFNTPVIITLSCNESGSTIYWTVDGSTPLAPGDPGFPGTTSFGEAPQSFLLSTEGNITIKCFSIDLVGNRELL